MRLTPIVAGYAVGRAVVSGSAVWTAGKAAESLERVRRDKASPLPLIAGVLIALTPLVLATQVDWRTLIEQRRVRLLPRSRQQPSRLGAPVPVERHRV